MESPRRGLLVFSVRFQIILMLALGIIVLGIMRFNIQMAIVCMVNSTNTSDENANDYRGDLDWTSAETAYVFSATYWGNLATVLLSGWLAGRFGAKALFLISAIGSIVASLLTPVTAEAHIAAVIVVRFFLGLAQGVRQPCTAAILSNWIPITEMSLALAIITGGMQFASVISNFMVTGLCSQTTFLGGWPSVFYVSAILGVVWCLVWPFTVTNRATECSRVKSPELEYITSNLKQRGNQADKVPWRHIFTSGAVWAIVFCSFADNLITYTISMYMPTYFQKVHGLSIVKNGVYSSMPLVCQGVGKMTISYVAGILKQRTSINHNLIAKVFNSIACFGQGTMLILVAYLPLSNISMVELLICLGSLLSSGFTPGYWTSIQALSPPFSSTLQSLASFSSIIATIACPYMIGHVTTNETASEWKIVFATVAGVLLVAGIFYAIFGKAERQEWGMAESSAKIECNDEKLSNGHALSNGKAVSGNEGTKDQDEISMQEKF